MSKIRKASVGGPTDVARSLGRTPQGVVAWALTQAGDPYVLGAEASPNDPNPPRFDCSELVEWACARAGVKFVDGAYNQFSACKRAGKLISVGEALFTPGALLFVAKCGACGGGGGNHVAISQGNGKTIEARGRAYGVGEFPATRRSWTHAGLIPGLNYGNRSTVNMAVFSNEAAANFLRAVNLQIRFCANVTLKKGVSAPDCVNVLQIRLRALGYPVSVNGKFDTATQASVQKFQKRNRLKSNGQVDRSTWKALFTDIV
jgi:hypothetical protein